MLADRGIILRAVVMQMSARAQRSLLVAILTGIVLLVPSSGPAIPVCNEKECVASSLCGNYCSFSGSGACYCAFRAVIIYCEIPGDPPRLLQGYDCVEDWNCNPPGGGCEGSQSRPDDVGGVE
jgi:hypothetical protein